MGSGSGAEQQPEKADTLSLDQVLAQLMIATESGESINIADLAAKHPHLAEDLQEFAKNHEEFIAAAEAAREVVNASSQDQLDGPQIDNASTITKSTELPKLFGGYEIIEEIDRGGMGIVYKARQKAIGRIVALKVIRSGELASEQEVKRFYSEAEAAAALSHPGIVPVYEVGDEQGLVFFTMAFIEGQNLSEIVERGPLPLRQAIEIAIKICQAVEYAHLHGVLHRDLKPANILLSQTNQPVLIDFGLAKISHHDSALTASGQLLGTPAYMAPEYASGRMSGASKQQDVYAIGAILYFLCAGQPPFVGPTPFDVLLQVLDRQPAEITKLRRDMPRALDQICTRALSKDPANRYQSAQELEADLVCVLEGRYVAKQKLSIGQRIKAWWRREPILVVHLSGIGLTMLIVAAAALTTSNYEWVVLGRLGLLAMWLVMSVVLQSWVRLASWRDFACLTWATVDVFLYTTLVSVSDPPRGMLLIGYPMLIVASAMFYRKSFVIYMTSLSFLGFVALLLLNRGQDFARLDFCAIFASGLGVICLGLTSMIRRVRSLSAYQSRDDRT